MDPTRYLSLIPPLEEITQDNIKEYLPQPLSSTNDKINMKISMISKDEGKIYATKNLLSERNKLSRLLDGYDKTKVELVSQMIYPLWIIQGPFLFTNTIELANLDTLFELTPSTQTLLNYMEGGAYLSGVLGDYEGGFIEYLNFRFPNGLIVTLSEKNRTNPAIRELIKGNQYLPIMGDNLNGDIESNWDNYIRFIQSNYSQGLDFYSILDSSTFKIIITQVYIALKTLKLGRNMVIRVNDLIEEKYIDLLYLLTKIFQKVYIIKPSTSNPLTAEKYIICKYLLEKKNLVLDIFPKIMDNKIQSFIIKKDVETIDKINVLNDELLLDQIESSQTVKDYLDGKSPNIESYDLNLPLIIWNLPSSRNQITDF